MLKYILYLFISILSLIPGNIYHYHQTPNIILITLDGVRWQDIFEVSPAFGNFPRQESKIIIPNIYHHFIENGIAIGKTSIINTENFAHVSLPGYIEILSGQASDVCFNNECKQNKLPTLINQFPNDSAVFASWELIDRVFDNTLATVNVGRAVRNNKWLNLHLPNDTILDDQFGDEEYRSDEFTMRATLDFIKIKQPSFLWVSLGDTDEYAHWGNAVFYWASLNAMDTFIGELMKQANANTIFVICTDHGRGKNFTDHGIDPTSRRVFTLIGGNINKEEFTILDKEKYLSNIYDTILYLRNNKDLNKSLVRKKY